MLTVIVKSLQGSFLLLEFNSLIVIRCSDELRVLFSVLVSMSSLTCAAGGLSD